jgi:hypothetical protein
MKIGILGGTNWLTEAFGVGIVLWMCAPARAQNLFVSSSQGFIYEITPGGIVSQFDSRLSGNPSQLALNSSGNLFVEDEGSILEITPAGVMSTFATDLTDMGGLAFNSAGDLFVSDLGANASGLITEITPNGTKSTFATGLDGPRGLVFDNAGDLFVGTATGIVEFGNNGTTSTFASVSGGVNSLAFNSSLDLFAENGTNILEFAPGGTTRSTFASIPSYQGSGQMAFNSAGNLFVASPIGGVLEFTPNGTKSTFASTFGDTDGLAFAVPEPSVLELLGLGAVALFMKVRKIRSTTTH